MKRHAGKALPILLVLLVGVALVGGVIWFTKFSGQMKADGSTNRMAITSALRSAAKAAQDSTGNWPKNVDELKTDPKVQALGDLGDVKYDFVKTNEHGQAIYQVTLNGKKSEVIITPKKAEPQKPIGNTPQ